MFYLGYCGQCNFLDADLDREALHEFLLEHQLAKHRKIEQIHIMRMFLPFKAWLEAKKSPQFWEAWRHRKKVGHVLGRLEDLRRSHKVS